MNFDNDIQRIANEMLQDGTVEEIIREKVKEGFSDAVDSAFRWGELKNAIENRVKSVMVPFVEGCDLSNYIVKMDSVLSEIVANSMLVDNARILENFKELMTAPEKNEVTLKEMMEEYKKYVAANVNTDGLEVIVEDTAYYEYVECFAEIEEEEKSRWFSSKFSYAKLVFHVEGNNDSDNEELAFQVRLTKYEDSRRPGWEIRYDSRSDVSSLKRLSSFEVYLMKLASADVRIVGDCDSLSDEVGPDAEPEASWS